LEKELTRARKRLTKHTLFTHQFASDGVAPSLTNSSLEALGRSGTLAIGVYAGGGADMVMSGSVM
jgi:hypothetical protein